MIILAAAGQRGGSALITPTLTTWITNGARNKLLSYSRPPRNVTSDYLMRNNVVVLLILMYAHIAVCACVRACVRACAEKKLKTDILHPWFCLLLTDTLPWLRNMWDRYGHSPYAPPRPPSSQTSSQPLLQHCPLSATLHGLRPAGKPVFYWWSWRIMIHIL